MAKATTPRNADQRMANVAVKTLDIFDDIADVTTKTRPEIGYGNVASSKGTELFIPAYSNDELAALVRKNAPKPTTLVAGRDFPEGQLSKVNSRIGKALRSEKRGSLQFEPGQLTVRPFKKGEKRANSKGELVEIPCDAVQLIPSI